MYGVFIQRSRRLVWRTPWRTHSHARNPISLHPNTHTTSYKFMCIICYPCARTPLHPLKVSVLVGGSLINTMSPAPPPSPPPPSTAHQKNIEKHSNGIGRIVCANSKNTQINRANHNIFSHADITHELVPFGVYRDCG